MIGTETHSLVRSMPRKSRLAVSLWPLESVLIRRARFLSTGEDQMLKSQLLAALKAKIQRHDFSHFVENPPSVVQGGKGVVVPGCPACRKRLNTMPQFLDHLCDDVLPGLLNRLSAARNDPRSRDSLKFQLSCNLRRWPASDRARPPKSTQRQPRAIPWLLPPSY